MLDMIGQRQQALLHLLLRQKSGLTIDQMAGELNITRTAVREHVAALANDRLVAPGEALPSTGGRPSRRYRLTQRGIAAFPKHYDLIARLLLETLAQRVGEGAVESELRAIGRAIALRFKDKVGDGTLAARTEVVAELMCSLGYEASAVEAALPEIEAFNCVYHDLARADPTVCALDLALIEELADAEVEHRSCMARGDDSCRFCLRTKESNAGGAG